MVISSLLLNIVDAEKDGIMRSIDVAALKYIFFLKEPILIFLLNFSTFIHFADFLFLF